MVKILTVEDSDFERKYIKDILNKNGYPDVLEANNGEVGLDLFKKNKPDLVLLDLRLPGMDGLECFKKMKEVVPSVKVIFVSIVTRKDSVEEAKSLGAKNYIFKPITKEKLMSAVKAVIK